VARIRAAILRTLAIFLLAAAAGGCSTIQFAYSTGPTALSFIADSYLDLDSDQAALLKERILAVREWNRSTQLADYSKFLAQVRARAAGNVTPEDVAWVFEEARARWHVLGARVADETADLAPRLNADNLKALRHKFDRKNEEYLKERINIPVHKQRERRFENVMEQAERWYGSFDDAQSARIRAMSDALPANYLMFFEDRKRRQQEFIATLSAAIDKSADRAATRQRLARLMIDWEAERSPALKAFASNYLAETWKMTAQIANLATPAQRETAQRRMQRWVEDMAALAARKDP
jgi:hypothetical protein